MMPVKVIQAQTEGGCYNSTITPIEAAGFNLLTPSDQEEYLQDCYLSRGHGEGADNLLALAEAIKSHGIDRVTTYTILI